MATTQAQRIIHAFGGHTKLSEALERVGRPRSIGTIYRWTWPREKGGTGGLVPTDAMTDVLYAAHTIGVELSDELLSPRVKQDEPESAKKVRA